VLSRVAWPDMGLPGMSQIGIREERCLLCDIAQTCWWLGVLQIGIRAKVSTLSLDGPW
jgi:hypothetical protein